MCISCKVLDLSPLYDEHIYEKFLTYLPESGFWKMRREKMKRYYFKDDKIRSLGASLLLISVLKEHGLENADIEINQYGKPFLCNSEMQFNLSHSGNYAVCSYGCGDNGIDIESYKNVDIDVAKCFFHQKEYELVKKYGEIMFTRLWTLKESYIKADGRGLGLGLNTFQVCPGECEKNFDIPLSSIPAFSMKTYIDSNDKINFAEFIINDYHIAVCSNMIIDNYLIINDLFQYLSWGRY